MTNQNEHEGYPEEKPDYQFDVPRSISGETLNRQNNETSTRVLHRLHSARGTLFFAVQNGNYSQLGGRLQRELRMEAITRLLREAERRSGAQRNQQRSSVVSQVEPSSPPPSPLNG